MGIKEIYHNRDVQNILAVLVTAILCAGLLAFLFIYTYGPSGRYLAGYTLLDPTIIEQINYQDQSPKGGKKVHFVFDRIEFSYFDPQKGEVHLLLPLQSYQKFYTFVASEKSLEKVTEDIDRFFLKSPPTLLTIHMRTMEASQAPTTKIFQVVHVTPEDYFRVQLHDKQEQGEWAYFYHAGLYQEVMRLFTSSVSL